jgi:hypothetical protein
LKFEISAVFIEKRAIFTEIAIHDIFGIGRIGSISGGLSVSSVERIETIFRIKTVISDYVLVPIFRDVLLDTLSL